MNWLSEHLDTDEPVEDCDCRRCAVAFRDRYKAALAAVSEEMGLPPMMGPAKGELKRLLDAGQKARDLLRNAPIAVSASADFDSLEWTFMITSDTRVAAGTYALVCVDAEYRDNSDSAAS
jgi:hypothetical protein